MNPPPEACCGASSPLIGQSVAAIDTPALVIDLDAMERNLQRMAAFARQQGLRLRPHAKMHKSVELARRQLQAGACGLCVQKLSEAEILAAGGIHDVFISNEIVAPAKLSRVAALADRLHRAGGRLAIAVDSVAGIDALARAMRAVPAGIDVFVEIDVGQGRCGSPPGAPAVALAQHVRACGAPLRLAGLHAYHGGAQHLRSLGERQAAIAQATQAVQDTRAAWLAAGLPAPLVTGAGTGTFALEAASGVWHELQAGSFMFMDADYARNEPDPNQPAFEQALFVKSQVISVGAGRAVCDAGHKSHAIDSGLPRVHRLPGAPALLFANGGDEHGILRPATADLELPALGATVWLVPGHCDPTVNLHDVMVGVRGGLVGGRVESIVRVDARGALV